MLLRESGKKKNRNYTLASVTSDVTNTGDSSDINDAGGAGVEQGELLRALADTVVAEEWSQLEKLRGKAASVLGDQGLVDALAVIAGFFSITRIADSTGIPLDEPTRKSTDDLRAETGINEFQYDQKNSRYQ